MSDYPLTHQRRWYQFMLDIAWPELLVIGIVAVVAIGPKDLPKVMHALGRWTGKARVMAQDFQRSLEQLNFEAEAADRLRREASASAQASSGEFAAPPHKPTPPPDIPHDRPGTT